MKEIKAFCHLPFTRAKIHCEGHVHMCCHQSFSFLGNLFESSEIVANPRNCEQFAQAEVEAKTLAKELGVKLKVIPLDFGISKNKYAQIKLC